MKFPLIVCVFLLTVSSSLSVNITVSGTEGRPVTITCPYAEGLKNAYKYFYRGYYSGRVSILESDGIETYANNGRFSLNDDHQTRSFSVTISYLKMEDAGPYGCKAGYGYENFNQVELIVIRAPETTTRVHISTSSITTYTNSNTEHTTTAVRSDLASVAGGLGSVLLVLTLCSGVFIILIKRKRKSATALFQQNVQQNTETDHMSEEIPDTDFNVVTSSSNQTPASSSNQTPASSSNQTPASSSNQTPASSSNQTPASSSNQTPASHLKHYTNESTVYATVTNQQPDSNPSHTLSTNQVTDTAGDYNYLIAMNPQNTTTDEDPLNAPRFLIN